MWTILHTHVYGLLFYTCHDEFNGKKWSAVCFFPPPPPPPFVLVYFVSLTSRSFMQSCVDSEMTCFCFSELHLWDVPWAVWGGSFRATSSGSGPLTAVQIHVCHRLAAEVGQDILWYVCGVCVCVCGGGGGACMQFVKAVKKTNSSTLQLYGEPLHAWPVVHDLLYFLTCAPKQTLSPAFLPDCTRACVHMSLCACQKRTVQYAFCPYLRH